MTAFLHLSDLHIHGDNKKNTQTIDTIDYCNEHYKYDNLLLTGDITDDGSREQYKRSLEILARKVYGRKFLAPGNHDKGRAGNFYEPSRSKMFDQFATRLKCTGLFHGRLSRPVVDFVEDMETRVMLIALDSCLETKNPFDFASGKIGLLQRIFLKRLVNNYKDYVKIVYFHHHLFMRNNIFMALKDAKKVQKIIDGKVDVVCFGHKHVFEKWENLFTIPYVLAAGSPAKGDCPESRCFGWRIIVTGKQVNINKVKIIS